MNLLKIIVFAYFLSSVLAGCGNSPNKQQAESVYPLKEIFNKIYIDAVEDYKKTAKDNAESLERYGLNTDVVYKMLQDSIVKNRLINFKSQAYYEMILSRFFYDMNTTFAYIQNDGKYFILLYEDYGHVRVNMPGTVLTYNPETDELNIETTIDGRVVQPDGKVHYNTEGWDVDIWEEKNDFNEVVNREPISAYLIAGKEYTYSKNKFALVMRLNYITLWTNEDNMVTGVKDIRVKDHDSGTIYNIAFDQPFFHKNGGAMNADIGVAIFDKNEADFINLISGLNNYTISIRSESGELLTLTNPENFNNIRDVYLKLVQMWENMKK